MPGPVLPRARPGRLGGLRTGPGPVKRGPRAPARPPPPPADVGKTCPNANCPAPDVHEEDGTLFCRGCFTQIAESNIVSEVTFDESAGGRATVQGGTVADNSRHARTLGAGAYRKVGGGERNNLADTQNAGRRALDAICPRLDIQDDHVKMQAVQIWTLAANINFSAGRRSDEVVAACLYAACRRQKENKILLMDIAEIIHINVFRLGEVYKDLCKELYLNDESVGQQHLVELEPLIYKYCDKLQFADKTREVATDALKIVRRMNRDWIVSGRHPAGLCGACIILAARMNNFQRTVREVVFVSKVADITIANRVKEFRMTKSAGLTVEEFRKYGNKIKHQHDPPSIYAQVERERKLENMRVKREQHKRKKEGAASQNPRETPASEDDTIDAPQRSSLEPVTPAPSGLTQGQTPEAPIVLTSQSIVSAEAISSSFGDTSKSPRGKRKRDDNGDATPPIQETSQSDGPSSASHASGNANGSLDQAQQPNRVDADGFAIPDIPASARATLQEDDTAPPAAKRKVGWPKGRPRSTENAPKIVISEEELAEEDYLEKQIEAALENGEVQESETEVGKAKKEELALLQQRQAALLASQQQKLDAEKIRQGRSERGIDYWGEPTAWEPGVHLSAEDLAAEFDNDPEVENCLLSPEEVKIKEQIWVTHNEDWLRKQAEKDMLAQIAKASGEGGGRGRKGKKAHGLKGKKRSRMGDGTVLIESSTPIQTPADAAKAMLEKRAPLKSQFVDFSALQRIYGRETPSRASPTTPVDSAAQSPPREQSVVSEREDQTADEDAQSEGGDEVEVEGEDEPPIVNKPVQPASWDDVGGETEVNYDDDEEEAEADFHIAAHLGQGPETDEFGALPDYYDDDYEDDYQEVD